MQCMLSNFHRYLDRPEARTASAVVAICGLLLGYFVGRTYVDRLPMQYEIPFAHAKWIQMPTPAKASYFRKDLYIPDSIERAWISIASTGSYRLIVNNIIIDDNQMAAARPSGLYDISGILYPGKNTVAVYVSADWSVGPRQIIVRGVCKTVGALPFEFNSDSSWRVWPVGASIPGAVLWSSPRYDDSFWQNSEEVSNVGRFSAAERIEFDPKLFEYEPAGKWISGPEEQNEDVTFSYQLDLNSKTASGWLQLAANGSYDVVINGDPAILSPSVNQAQLFGPDAPVRLDGRTVMTYSRLRSPIGPISGLPGARSFWSMPGRGFASPGSRESPQNSTTTTSTPPSIALGEALPDAIDSTPGLASTIGEIRPETAALTSERSGSPQQTGLTIYGEKKGTTANQRGRSSISGGLNLRQQTLPIPSNPDTSPLAPPSFGDIAPDPAPAAPQIVPRFRFPGPVPYAALTLTAYDIRDYLRLGRNQLTVHVHSVDRPLALLADGFTNLADGTLRRFGTSAKWTVAIASKPDLYPARVLGRFDAQPWGPPIQVAAYPREMPGDDIAVAARWAVTLTIVATLTFALWLLGPAVFNLKDPDAYAFWNADAVFHLAVLVTLLMFLLTSYDVRFPYDWCFRGYIVASVLLLILVEKLLLLTAFTTTTRQLASATVTKSAGWYFQWQPLLLLLIMLAGMVLRTSHLTTQPLGHDEVQMALLSRSIAKVGYPYLTAGSYTRLMSTYELVPYPIAFFSAILGPSILALRLPALLFGTLTIGIIGWVGHRMFDWRVGFLAALIWTLLPIPINWSQDGFYLSQECFFALVTFWTFYEAIRGSDLDRRYIRLAAAAFVLTYLSWEASGFILPTLVVSIVVLRWSNWNWVRDTCLWKSFSLIATIVVVQLCYRQMTLTPNY
jgi:hypothetical protein